MAQLKYLDLTGLQTFWTKAKDYIDTADALAVKKADIVNDLTTGGTDKVLSAEQGKTLKGQVDAIAAGGLTVPVATDAKVGGVLSGNDITVAGTGAVTVNQAAKLTTARTITFAGDLSGNFDFDGSTDKTATVTLSSSGTLAGFAKKAGDSYSGTHTYVNGATLTLDNGSKVTTVAGSSVDLSKAAVTLGAADATTQTTTDNSTKVATTAFVKAAIDAAVGDSDHIVIKGTVNTNTHLPEADYKLGDAYIVGEAGTYAGETCEAGDWIIAIKDYADPGAGDGDWSKIQKNITSAVTFTGTPTAGQVVKFNAATGIVENASFTEAQVSTAITKAGSAVQSVTVATPTGDANPSADVSDNAVTIKLPAYLLKSTYDTAIAGISGTIKDYVDTAVAGATITADGVINHGIGDSGTETVKVVDNVITISLKNYALASALTALNGEVDANTAKLADITGTVGATIDSKITAGLADGGVIDNRIDALITAAVNTSGTVDTAIDNKLDTAVEEGGVVDAAIDTKLTDATAGDAAYIPTVAVTSEEIEGMFGA